MRRVCSALFALWCVATLTGMPLGHACTVKFGALPGEEATKPNMRDPTVTVTMPLPTVGQASVVARKLRLPR